MKPYNLAASLICGNPLSLRQEVESLVRGGIDYIHFDVMDGMFVPRYGLYPELLKAVRSITDLPIEVHMMVEEPARYVPQFAEAGASALVVHSEASKHLHYALETIHRHGIKAGVALNYATPLNVLDYIMDEVEIIMLMAINPGIIGHKLIPGIFKKIEDLKQKIDKSGRDVLLAIDGGVSQESAPKMVQAGANYLVCGTSAIYKPDTSLEMEIKNFRAAIKAGT